MTAPGSAAADQVSPGCYAAPGIGHRRPRTGVTQMFTRTKRSRSLMIVAIAGAILILWLFGRAKRG